MKKSAKEIFDEERRYKALLKTVPDIEARYERIHRDYRAEQKLSAPYRTKWAKLACAHKPNNVEDGEWLRMVALRQDYKRNEPLRTALEIEQKKPAEQFEHVPVQISPPQTRLLF